MGKHPQHLGTQRWPAGWGAVVGDAEEGFHSSPQLSAHLRPAEHKAVPSDGWVTSPCQAHCLPDGVLGRQGGCRRRSGFSAVPRDGHCLPPARLGSPQYKDLASGLSAGISPGRAGAGQAPPTTTRSCTSELREGPAQSKADEQSPAHLGPAGRPHQQLRDIQISVQPGSPALSQSSPTEEPWACIHLPNSSGGM